MAIKHRIRVNGKGKMSVVTLTHRKAIMAHCKECLGFETHPKECTSPHCPLFPFRTGAPPKDTV